MRLRRLTQLLADTLGIAALLLPLLASSTQQAQPGDSAQQKSPPSAAEKIPVIQTTTTLVFLDVTVLDKKGNPVTTGLTQDDFTITEDKKPQRIFSFEEPQAHEKEDGQLPKTVLVLDLLNTPFDDFSYVHDQARQYLLAQPETLPEETELMLVGNQTFEMLQGFTQNRSELLSAIDHIPAVLPVKEMREDWKADRIRQSYIALQQIAVQNRGMPGRKNVLWIGSGSPNLTSTDVADSTYDKVQQYIHRTVNMMVEARITLFLIYPKLRQGYADTRAGIMNRSTTASKAVEYLTSTESADSLAKSNFTKFVYETGGKVFDLNNVSGEISDSQQLGSNYYTLTYQPRDDKANGVFRKIQVKLKNPDLHVMTKAGFYAREPKEAAEADDKTLNMLTEASLSVIPFKALHIRLANLVRHPDAHTLEIAVRLDDSKLGWQSINGGFSETTVILEAAMTSARGDMLASRVAKYALVAKSQDASRLASVKPEVKIALRLPSGARNMRVAVATSDGSRIGSLDLSRKEIDEAPEAPSRQSPKS